MAKAWKGIAARSKGTAEIGHAPPRRGKEPLCIGPEKISDAPQWICGAQYRKGIDANSNGKANPRKSQQRRGKEQQRPAAAWQVKLTRSQGKALLRGE